MMPWEGLSGLDEAPTIAMVRASVRSFRSTSGDGFWCGIPFPYSRCAPDATALSPRAHRRAAREFRFDGGAQATQEFLPHGRRDAVTNACKLAQLGSGALFLERRHGGTCERHLDELIVRAVQSVNRRALGARAGEKRAWSSARNGKRVRDLPRVPRRQHVR